MDALQDVVCGLERGRSLSAGSGRGTEAVRTACNLLYAFGHQHLGVTLAAVTGKLVAALAVDATPQLPLEPFSLRRFA